MNPKTKEAIKEVLLEKHYGEIKTMEALSKIIAIVEQERQGEVVLFHGHIDADQAQEVFNLVGKKGRLIFIPDEVTK